MRGSLPEKEQLKALQRQIDEAEAIKETKSLSLAKAQGNLIDELNQQIETQTQTIKELNSKLTQTKEDITAIDQGLQSEGMSYENFLNFFQNIGNMLKINDNQLLVDKITRMIFLNFTIKDQKVTEYRLNLSFEQHVKIPSVQLSRGWRT